jgi:hypothetical protein
MRVSLVSNQCTDARRMHLLRSASTGEVSMADSKLDTNAIGDTIDDKAIPIGRHNFLFGAGTALAAGLGAPVEAQEFKSATMATPACSG